MDGVLGTRTLEMVAEGAVMKEEIDRAEIPGWQKTTLCVVRSFIPFELHPGG